MKCSVRRLNFKHRQVRLTFSDSGYGYSVISLRNFHSKVLKEEDIIYTRTVDSVLRSLYQYPSYNPKVYFFLLVVHFSMVKKINHVQYIEIILQLVRD